MRLADHWRQIVCRVRGHQWMTYWYPEGDGWFGNPHWRQECNRCEADRVHTSS